MPIRFLFRSRWAALAWSAGICASAIQVARDHRAAPVDARAATADAAAQADALAAEDRD